MARYASILLVLLAAAPAGAKPPVLDGYARLDDLEVRLAAVADRMRAEEEFAAKPFQERLLIRFKEGAESYEELRTLDGEDVVRELLERWKGAQVEPPNAEVLRILALLPEALASRYAVTPIPKRERYKASKPLVDALTDRYFHIRKAAIEGLKAIYGQTRSYQPDFPAKRRADIQKDWKRQIDRLAR